jgi:predicted DNA-binding mobile mystery protein A
MTTAELAVRMDISQSRASRLERGEVNGTIRLSTLRQAAKSLNCTLHYVLVPNESLEDMVLRQAHRKATQELAHSNPDTGLDPDGRFEAERDDWLEVRTLELVDVQGLWFDGFRPRPGAAPR